MSYYQQCTTGTFLLCSIYVCILRAGQTHYVKTCFIRLLNVGLCEKKTYSTFRHNLLQHFGVNTAFPLNSYKQLDFFSSTNSAWIRALENLHGFFFSFFLSLFFFLKYIFVSFFSEIFFFFSFCVISSSSSPGLISTSLWFSGTVFHLVLSFQHLFFHCCGHSPSQGSESR